MIETYLKKKNSVCMSGSTSALVKALPGEKVRCVIPNVSTCTGSTANAIIFESGCSLWIFSSGAYEIVNTQETKKRLSSLLEQLKEHAELFERLNALLGGE